MPTAFRPRREVAMRHFTRDRDGDMIPFVLAGRESHSRGIGTRVQFNLR
jgi:hypothetical protein